MGTRTLPSGGSPWWGPAWCCTPPEDESESTVSVEYPLLDLLTDASSQQWLKGALLLSLGGEHPCRRENHHHTHHSLHSGRVVSNHQQSGTPGRGSHIGTREMQGLRKPTQNAVLSWRARTHFRVLTWLPGMGLSISSSPRLETETQIYFSLL